MGQNNASNSKEDVILRLYGLRAGLSAIAVKKDERDACEMDYNRRVKKIDDDIADVNDAITDVTNTIAGLNKSISDLQENKEKCFKDLLAAGAARDSEISEFNGTPLLPPSDEEIECQKRIDEYKKATTTKRVLRVRWDASWGWLITGWASFILTVSGIINLILIACCDKNIGDCVIAILLVIIGAGYFLFYIIALIYVWWDDSAFPLGMVWAFEYGWNDHAKKTKKEMADDLEMAEWKEKKLQELIEQREKKNKEIEKENAERHKEHIMRATTNYNDRIQRINNQIQEYRDEIEEAKEQIKSKGSDIDSLNKKKQIVLLQKSLELNAYSKLANTMYTALVGEYSKLLIASDWPMLDQILYALESGRADTLKEAMLQADSERRKDEIVSTMRVATSQIKNTIYYGVKGLSEQLDSVRSSIQSELADMYSDLEYKIDSTGRLIGRRVDQIERRNSEMIGELASGVDASISALSSNMDSLSDSVNSRLDNTVIDVKNALMSKSDTPSAVMIDDIKSLIKRETDKINKKLKDIQN